MLLALQLTNWQYNIKIIHQSTNSQNESDIGALKHNKGANNSATVNKVTKILRQKSSVKQEAQLSLG